MKLLLLFSLLLWCSAAPISKEKTRKAKQLEPIVASGYSHVVRGAPNKRIQAYQPPAEKTEPEARSALDIHAETDNQQSDISQADRVQSRTEEVQETEPHSLLPETVSSDLPEESVPVVKLPNISILPDGKESTQTSLEDLATQSELITNEGANPAPTVTTQNDETQKAEQEVVAQVVNNDKMQIETVHDEEKVNEPTKDSLLTEQVVKITASDDSEKSEITEAKDDSNPLTHSRTAEEVITLPFQISKMSDDKEMIVSQSDNVDENVPRDLVQFEEATDVPEPVTSVELLSEEVKNLPPLEEAKLDDFSSSIILESEPLPKMEDEGSIIELLPSNAESLFDLEVNDNVNLNDLVKRNSESSPLEATMLSDAEKRPEDSLANSGIAVQDDQPVDENPIVSLEVKPDCDEDHVNKEDFKVSEPSEARPVEEVESQVIVEQQSS